MVTGWRVSDLHSSHRTPFEQPGFRRSIAIPVNGGPHERVLDIGDRGVEMFDWINTAYLVEPKNHLTTLWGKSSNDI